MDVNGQLVAIDWSPSGTEPLQPPLPGILPGITNTVVQPAGAALPKLHHLRDQPVATPGAGQGNHRAFRILFREGKILLLQPLPARNGRALHRGMSAQLAGAGAAMKVGFAFLTRHLPDASPDIDLSLQLLPKEPQSSSGLPR